MTQVECREVCVRTWSYVILFILFVQQNRKTIALGYSVQEYYLCIRYCQSILPNNFFSHKTLSCHLYSNCFIGCSVTGIDVHTCLGIEMSECYLPDLDFDNITLHICYQTTRRKQQWICKQQWSCPVCHSVHFESIIKLCQL